MRRYAMRCVCENDMKHANIQSKSNRLIDIDNDQNSQNMTNLILFLVTVCRSAFHSKFTFVVYVFALFSLVFARLLFVRLFFFRFPP